MATEKRLIDANALEEILRDFESRYKKACFVLSAQAVENVRKIVFAMKTVDAVEVVHGDWYGVGNMWMCTVCEDQHPVMYNYCPNCGAKMDGDGNE